MILKFKEFTNEMKSDLISNHAPLYHFTNSFYLIDIINDDVLSKGWFQHKVRNKNTSIVSLTRNKNFNITYYKNDTNIRICLDSDKLRHDYSIIPYDFFINSNTEHLPKSNPNRKSKYEYEEICSNNIYNIHKYIISIDLIKYVMEYENGSLDLPIKKLLNLNKNIKINVLYNHNI